jgi:hypothetical protein
LIQYAGCCMSGAGRRVSMITASAGALPVESRGQGIYK